MDRRIVESHCAVMIDALADAGFISDHYTTDADRFEELVKTATEAVVKRMEEEHSSE